MRLITKSLDFLSTLIFFLFLSVNALALDPNPEGELAIQVVASATPEYIEEWVRTPPEHSSMINGVRQVIPEQTFYVAVIVTGYGLGEKSETDLIGDFILQNPDGTVMFDEKNVFAHKRVMKHRIGFVMLDPAVDLTLEEDDQRGTYTFQATVHDKVSGKTQRGEYKITLRDAESARINSFDSEEQFSEWVTYYYLAPQPERVSSAIRYYAGSALYEKQNTRILMAPFFASLLQQDAGLLRQAYDDVGQDGSEDAQIFFLNVLWLVDTEESRALLAKARTDWTAEPLQRVLARMEGHRPDHLLEDPVDSPADLDRLWVMFMATGDAAPVRKIISVLHLLEEGHGEEIIVGGAARWSLTSNARQHKRVYEICQQELRGTEGTTKSLLEQVLAEADKKER